MGFSGNSVDPPHRAVAESGAIVARMPPWPEDRDSAAHVEIARVIRIRIDAKLVAHGSVLNRHGVRTRRFLADECAKVVTLIIHGIAICRGASTRQLQMSIIDHRRDRVICVVDLDRTSPPPYRVEWRAVGYFYVDAPVAHYGPVSGSGINCTDRWIAFCLP